METTECQDYSHYKEVCPGCKTPISSSYICHFYYGTWDCWGCGATLDSRVVSPEVRHVVSHEV